MKNRITKMLSLILTAVTLVGIMAISTSAASSDDDYDLYIAGVQVTKDNCNDVLGDGGSVKYDGQILTLTNADLTKSFNTDNNSSTCYYGIEINDAVTINLVGENKIDFSGFSLENTNIRTVNGIYMPSNEQLEITGNGSLYIATADTAADSRGIVKEGGTISFTGGTVEIHTGNSCNTNGIDNEDRLFTGIVSVTNGADLKVFTGNIEADNYSSVFLCGIRCDTFIAIESSTVLIENGDIIAAPDAENTYNDLNCAVYCTSAFTVNDSSLTASAGTTSGIDNCDDKQGSYGIYNDIVFHFKNCNLTASGYDFAVKSAFLNVNDDKNSGLEFFYSENADGSELKKYENTKPNKQFDKPYLVIAPEGTVELPEKSFFEKIAEFFENLFESIMRAFNNIF